MESVQVPFHFASTFLVTIAAAGAFWISLRRPEFRPEGRLARSAFITAWAFLALGEIIHGSLIAPGDLDQNAVALRVGGYAFLAASLLPSRHAGPRAGAAATSGSLALMPTILGFAASFFAARSGLAGRRRLAVALGLLATAEVFFGLGGAGAAGTAGFTWFAGHGIRLAGGVAVALWLWEAFRTSIQFRFIAAFIALLLVVVISVSGAMTQVFASNVRENELRQSALEGESQEDALNDERDELIRTAKLAAGLDSIRQNVALRSPSLPAIARAFQEPGQLFENLDFMAFFDPGGAILALSDAQEGGPALTETDRLALAGTEVVQAALKEKVDVGSIDAIGETKLAVIGAAPVFNPPGIDPPGAPQGMAGAAAVGILIDLDYLEALSNENLNFSAISRKAVLASTLLDQPSGLLSADLRPLFERGEVVSDEGTLGRSSYFSAYVPLERTDGQVVGALVVSRPSEVLALTQQDVGRTLFAFAIMAFVVAVVASYFAGARITRPIIVLTGAARRVREGDLNARAEIAGSDEVGTLGETFNEMVVSIGNLTGDLRSAATQLETILQSLTDGVVAVDADGRVVAFNREAERITGKKKEQVEGRRIDEVLTVTDGSGSRISLPVYELRAGAVPSAVISAGRSSKIPVAVTSAPIQGDNGEVVGAVAVVRDLTSEVALERAKTEFLSNISHELNTPLTPIMGWATMLRRGRMPKTQMKSAVDGILTSARRLERIVRMLVDVSSMEAGRLTVKKGPVDLGKVVGRLVERWKADAPKHAFSTRGFRGLPAIDADARLLSRAIDELIDNAVKFSPKGGRVVIVAEPDTSRNGTQMRVSVIDQGIGISEEQLATIFNEFVQIDPSETRAYGGLGLGLSYVRRIVDAHQGRLEVKSRAEGGSTFSIILPLSAEALAVGAARRTRAAGSRTAGRKSSRSGSTARPRRPISRKRR